MAVERDLIENQRRRVQRQYDTVVKERQILDTCYEFARKSLPVAANSGLIDELTLHYGRLYVKLLSHDLEFRKRLESSAWRILCEQEGWDPNEDHGDELTLLQKAGTNNGRP